MKKITLLKTVDDKIAQSSSIVCRVRVCRLSGVVTGLGLQTTSENWKHKSEEIVFRRFPSHYGDVSVVDLSATHVFWV